jgi:hypothetical protein
MAGPFGGDSNGDLGDDGGDSGDSGTGVSSVVASTDRCSYEQRLAGIERSKRHMTVIAIGAGQVQPVVACFGFPPAGDLLRVRVRRAGVQATCASAPQSWRRL